MSWTCSCEETYICQEADTKEHWLGTRTIIWVSCGSCGSLTRSWKTSECNASASGIQDSHEISSGSRTVRWLTVRLPDVRVLHLGCVTVHVLSWFDGVAVHCNEIVVSSWPDAAPTPQSSAGFATSDGRYLQWTSHWTGRPWWVKKKRSSTITQRWEYERGCNERPKEKR